MSTGRTADLTFTFVVERQDDGGLPWVATLKSIEPRDPENCGKCSSVGCLSERRLCDACSAEGTMDCMGPEDWLEKAGIKLDKEGVLVVNAYISWWHTSDQNGEDWDDETHINWSRWE